MGSIKKLLSSAAVCLLLVMMLTSCVTDPAEHLEKADAAFAQQDYQQAAGLYEKAALGGAGVAAWRGLSDSRNALDDGTEETLSQRIAAYEGLYDAGGFETADYVALAGCYAAAGKTAAQRDMLEKAYRLNPDETMLATLDSLCVNVTDDLPDVRAAVESLRAHFAAGETDAAVTAVADDALFDLLFPKLSAGHRRYICTSAEDAGLLRVEAGYDAQGARYIDCWYAGADNSATFVGYRGGAILTVAQGALSAGIYDGAFTVRCCNALDGSVTLESVAFKSGVCAGELVSGVSTGNAGTAAELWAMRETAEGTDYSGSFNNGGTTAEKQQPRVTGDTGIVYAYNAAATKFLYLKTADGAAADYIFTSDSLGVPAFPTWEAGQAAA